MNNSYKLVYYVVLLQLKIELQLLDDSNDAQLYKGIVIIIIINN